MRLSFFLSALSLTPALFAQSVNEFGIYPGATTFTSHCGCPVPGAADKYYVYRIDVLDVCNVGQTFDAATTSIVGRANGFRVVIQDQNASTQEWYTYAILDDDTMTPGQPAIPTAATPARFETAQVMPPVGAASPAAWQITSTLATPYDMVPQSQTFHLGCQMQGNGNWSQDGLSIHSGSFTSGTAGDNPSAAAPVHTHAIDNMTGTLYVSPSGRSVRVYIMSEGSAFNTGADIDPTLQRGPNPSFGMAGPYLDRGRADGLAWRLRDAANPGAAAFAVGSFNGLAAVNFPLVEGQLCPNIVPFGLFVLDTQALDANGEYAGVMPFAVFPFMWPAGFPGIAMQGLVLAPGLPSGSLIRASNGMMSNP